MYFLGPTCELRKRPKNGALSCLPFPKLQCQPLCKEGYDFGYKPAFLYYCIGKTWYAWSFPPILGPSSNLWPDCGRKCIQYNMYTQ